MITVINKRNAKRTLTAIDKKYCRKKLLEKFTWYDTSKLPKIAEIPLADKKIDSKKTDESNPPLGFVLMSSNISAKKVWVSGQKVQWYE